MSRIKIISDSTCDLPEEFLTRYDVTVTPLYVCMDGAERRDGVDITPAEIFAHVDAGGELCSTSAVSVHDYETVFARYAAEYDGVLQITIGANFSACYQNAVIAAAEFPNVRVVDSENLSIGQGLLVAAAGEMVREGLGLDEIEERLHLLRGKVETSFLIDRLDYMAKGGRCSAVTALGANLLRLKPCIEVRGGKMAVVKKYRGSFEKCMLHYVAERLDGREDIDRTLAFLSHSAVPEETVAATRGAVEERGVFHTLCMGRLGCTVSCHCGPHTMGVVFLRK